jgi:hypothetical protein
MFVLLGFAAQVCVFLSITAIVISCIPSPISVTLADSDELDATLPMTTSYCAKPMTSPAITTTIDNPVSPADDLSSLTIRQLKALCKSRGIKRYSNLRKHELISLLSKS